MNKRKSILSWLLVAAMLFGLFVPSAFAEEPETPVDPDTSTDQETPVDPETPGGEETPIETPDTPEEGENADAETDTDHDPAGS